MIRFGSRPQNCNLSLSEKPRYGSNNITWKILTQMQQMLKQFVPSFMENQSLVDLVRLCFLMIVIHHPRLLFNSVRANLIDNKAQCNNFYRVPLFGKFVIVILCLQWTLLFLFKVFEQKNNETILNYRLQIFILCLYLYLQKSSVESFPNAYNKNYQQLI